MALDLWCCFCTIAAEGRRSMLPVVIERGGDVTPGHGARNRRVAAIRTSARIAQRRRWRRMPNGPWAFSLGAQFVLPGKAKDGPRSEAQYYVFLLTHFFLSFFFMANCNVALALSIFATKPPLVLSLSRLEIVSDVQSSASIYSSRRFGLVIRSHEQRFSVH